MKPRKNVSARKQVKGLKLPHRKKRLDEVLIWLEDARRDYTAAVNLAKHLDAKVHREVLRLLHDSVEKSQKALLLSLGRDFPRGPRGHDLITLADLAKDKVKVPNKYADIIQDLSLIYTRTRYLEEGSLAEKWYEDAYLLNYVKRVGELNKWLRTKAG